MSMQDDKGHATSFLDTRSDFAQVVAADESVVCSDSVKCCCYRSAAVDV
jgi:hypothetical protein